MKFRFIDVEGKFAWTRSVKGSMESAFTSAPLCRLAWRMVVQMLSGRAYGWDSGGGGEWCWARTGWVSSLLTMWMLELSMKATEMDVVANATAVQNWSESAARWEVWLWPIEVWVVFCECFLHDIAML